MLISKRRLKWGFCGLLVGLLAIFFRPPRSWVDYALVRQLDKDLRVGQLHYHRGDSVIELKRVNWTKFDNGCSFGVLADNAWLAVESEPLLDRRLVIPRGEIRQASLFLHESEARPSDDSAPWQNQVSSYLSRVDWDGLLGRFSKLLDADGFAESTQLQIDKWLAESHAIQREVAQISTSLSAGNNPLREEDLLRGQLERMDQLLERHQQLSNQLQAVPKRLEVRGEDLMAQLSLQGHERTRELILGEGLQECEEQIAQTIVLQLAHSQWDAWQACGRIAYLVASRLPSWDRPEYDVDLPLGSSDPSVLTFSNLNVSGTFREGQTEMPFKLAAQGVADRNAKSPAGAWDFEFDAEGFWSTASVRRPERPGTSSVELRVFSADAESADSPVAVADDYEASPSDRMVTESIVSETDAESQPSAIAANADRRDYLLRISLQTTESLISGEMELTTTAITEQIEESIRIFEKALAHSGGELPVFPVKIQGTWQAPEFSLPQGIPAWLDRAIQAQVREHIVNVNSHADAEVRNAFERELSTLQNSVHRMTSGADAILQQHQQSMLSARERLERRIAELTGAAFTAYRQQASDSTTR